MKKTSIFLKNYKILLLLCSIGLVAVCCNTTHSLPSTSSATLSPSESAALPPAPGESELTIAQIYWPGTTLSYLNEGHVIFCEKCTQCHYAKRPEEFTVYAWNVILHQMSHKAKLDSIQAREVLQYTLSRREVVLELHR